MQNLHISIAFLILILSSSAAIGLKRSDPIMLLPEKIAINPTEFYIQSVTDDRNFRDKVQESLTPDNYQGIINFEYVGFYREMNKIQEKYDFQAKHGTNSVMQGYWNRKIDKDLLLMRIKI